MEKSEDAFRTIGEMSRELGVKTHILRYWEEQFPTLNPLKRAGGRRHYRREDVALLKHINHLLNEEGYTIKGAVKALNNGGTKNGSDAGRGYSGSGGVAGERGHATESAPAKVHNDTEVTGIDAGELRVLRARLATALSAA